YFAPDWVSIFINNRTFKSEFFAINAQSDGSFGNVDVSRSTHIFLVIYYKTAQAMRATEPVGLRNAVSRNGRRLFVRLVVGQRRIPDGHFYTGASYDECRA